ncbi:type IV secretion system DNA-binding domain-containing protein [Patescibacteria group bacterium]|nr:type IV secretion system DNA-binding domain-containing protein [Patescibacteria group bacterium]
MSSLLIYTLLGSVGIVGVGLGIAAFRKWFLRLPKDYEQEMVHMLIEVPRLNEKGPVAAELMFASIHGLLKETPEKQEHLSFEIRATIEGIQFFSSIPPGFEQFVKSQIYAQYPQAQISLVKDYSEIKMGKRKLAATEIVLSKESYNPIKTFPNFEVDPLAAITSAAEGLAEQSEAWLQLLVRPVKDDWHAAGFKYVNALRQGEKVQREPLLKALQKDAQLLLKDIVIDVISLIPEIVASFFNPKSASDSKGGDKSIEKKKELRDVSKLKSEERMELEGIETKLTKTGFESTIRIVGLGADDNIAVKQVDSLVAALQQFSTSHSNSFKRSEFVRSPEEVLIDYHGRVFPGDKHRYFVLNTEELASLFHLPNITVETPNIAWTKAKKVEYPLDLPKGAEPLIGETAFREERVQFGIKRDDRRRHMYIVGKTGTGKSTLLEQMIISDIRRGEGLAILDPHGDMVDKIINYVPRERVDDVVIFDPSDLYYPVAMNMLELHDPDQKGIVASGLVDVFRKRFEFSWGPRLEHILRNCILTLLEIPHSTLLGITRLLTDRTYRKYIVHLIEDPMMKHFWEVEFEGMANSKALVAEAISPIQNRLGQFLATSTIRNIVGQPRSTIDLEKIMNTGKIFLVNLSKGKIGEDNTAILGGMLISRMQSAAMTRVKFPEEQRKDFFVYADEFQNFATTSFATILSEARKYRLNLILAHQYLAQVPEEVSDAIFGNVGTMIAFTIGQADASILAKEFMPVFDETDLINLEKYHIYVKLMIDLMQAKPFSAKTVVQDYQDTGLREQVIQRSREQYATDRNMVESRVQKWAVKEFIPGMDDEVIQRLRQRLWGNKSTQ